MPRFVVLSIKDVGKNFRLLRHVKSLSSVPDSTITIISAVSSVIPSDITSLSNVKVMDIVPFFSSKYAISILLWPLELMYYIIVLTACAIVIGRSEYVLSSTSPLIIQTLCSFFLRRVLKSKLIFDVCPFELPSQKPNLHSIHCFLERKLPPKADYIVVPTRAMQVILKIRGIESFLIRDEAGTQFAPCTDLHYKLCEVLDIPFDYKLVSIPLPTNYHENAKLIGEMMTKLNEKSKKVALIMFGAEKSQRSLEESFTKKSTDSVILRFLPLFSDIYPQILGASDLAIAFSGSRIGFDVAPEVTEMVYSGVPIVVRKHGCVHEWITEGESGFFFSNGEELWEILRKCFVDSEVDLRSMRGMCVERIESWSHSWKETLGNALKGGKGL